MKNLKEKTLRGGFAKLCAQAAIFSIRVGSLMVLARLLEPKDFGLVGMVTAVIGVLNIFKDFGLSTATVQRATITDEQISTLFWINMLVGTTLGLLSLAIAPTVAAFYHEPRLWGVTAALAASFIFNAAGVQHSALLQRQMRFTAMAVIEVLSLFVSTTVGIGMAIGGCGYWALVGITLTSPAVSSICLWWATAWIPGSPRRQVGLRSMMRFGGTITLNGLVVYVAYNLEKVLLGRFWGTDAIGIYGRAYQLITIPTDNLNSAAGGVAFAALSRLQAQPERLKEYFLKGYALILALTVPLTIVCALFADDLIFVVLGAKWRDTAIIFRLLAPTILVFGLINPFGWFLFSIGHVSRSLKIALVIAPLTITGYLIGLPYGPKGIALASSIAMTLWVVPHITWCVHGTVLSFRDIILVASRPFFSGIVAFAPSFAFLFFCGKVFSPFPKLILGGAAFLSVYLGMLLCVMKQKQLYMDLLRGLRTRSSIEETAFVSA